MLGLGMCLVLQHHCRTTSNSGGVRGSSWGAPFDLGSIRAPCPQRRSTPGYLCPTPSPPPPQLQTSGKYG